MNPKVTPEQQTALDAQQGPVRLEDDADGEPVFLVRLADIPTLQETVDQRIRAKLAEADDDIASGNVAEFDAADVKQRGRRRNSLQ